ncbi:MAG: N-methyl-L-tryptophan oxidase [Planctomycetaceae bacterium]|jgi:sarcosine oxidase|nr:N-methyl-L-tryptophan oxidase [Planctomycetaceae bacterium]MDP7273925.1 N-methyl-L-tryptophan oxidase [Planctomycetaceae bacterium]
MSEQFDCIVVGVGGFGSGALDSVASRGLNVLGLERFGIAHDRGSSHGHTRVTRQAYFEHPDYVPLLIESYRLWDELAEDFGQPLLDRCGLLLAGHPDGPAVSGTRFAAAEHGLTLEDVSRKRLEDDFPGFAIPEEFEAVWEAAGGFLFVEDAVTAHIRRAVDRGAVLKTDETVISWTADNGAVEVTTDRGRYQAGALILAPGAWAPDLIPGLPIHWDIVRKPLFWFPATNDHYDRANGSGVFFLETPGGDFYGFPSLDGQTVKLAEHSAGLSIEDPLAVDRDVVDADLPPLVEYLETYMPSLSTTPDRHAVCFYTRTPDRHFVVDRHPEHSHVAIAAGFSGHGFKFTPAIGATLADLALDGVTDRRIEFLSATRPGLAPQD